MQLKDIKEDTIIQLAMCRVYTDSMDLEAELENKGIYLNKEEVEELYLKVIDAYGKLKKQTECIKLDAQRDTSVSRWAAYKKAFEDMNNKKYSKQASEGRLVVELRDNGMTFQEVANEVSKILGLNMSRQTAFYMYNKFKDMPENCIGIVLEDAVNIQAIIGNKELTLESVNNIHKDKTYNKVDIRNAVYSSEFDYAVMQKREELSKGMANLMGLGRSKEEICEVANYKGVAGRKKAVEDMILRAIDIYVNELLSGVKSYMLKEYGETIPARLE